MNKRNEPDHVDFSEKVDDGVMLNMEDLIKQQMQQREYDMNNIPPPTTLPTDPVIKVAPYDSSSNITSSFKKEDNPNVIVDKKTVTWKDVADLQTCKDNIATMRIEFESMRLEMRNQSTIIDSIRNELNKYHGISCNDETTRIVEEMVQIIETNNNL
jgi:hypothetical protein